jgi:hypothetical protein
MKWQEPCGSTYVLSPPPFRGDWRDLSGDGAIDFDFSVLGIEPDPNPFEVVVSGPGGSMKWTTPNPNSLLPWTRFHIPIRPTSWTVTSGDFDSILNAVTDFKIRVRIFNDTGWGTVIGIDNVVQSVQASHVPPASYEVQQGFYFGGNLGSLLLSDNNPLLILCDEFEANSQVEFSMTSPYSNPVSLKYVTETGSSRNDLIEMPQFFDFSTSAWVLVGGSMSTIADTRKIGVAAGDLSRLVRSGDNLIKSRITHIPSADISAADGWIVRIDQIDLRIAD